MEHNQQDRTEGFEAAGGVVYGYREERWHVAGFSADEAVIQLHLIVQAEGDATLIKRRTIALCIEVEDDELKLGPVGILPEAS